MKNIITITFILITYSNILSAQYIKEQVFEYEVMNVGRADISLRDIQTDYKNALMTQSGGRIFTGLGLILIPIGVLSELASISSISLNPNDNKSSNGSGIMVIGLVISGIGVFTWSIGTHNKNKVVNNYLESKYGLNSRAHESVGTLSASPKGLVFKYTF